MPIPILDYNGAFYKAGMVFFNRGNLITKYLKKITGCRYSHVGVYFKTSDVEYECWYCDIGAIEGANIKRCTIEKLCTSSELDLRELGIKPLRGGIGSEYEVKLRVTMAKLTVSDNINLADTIRELYDHREKTSRTPLQTFLVLNHELNKPTSGHHQTDFINVINQQLDVGFANIDCYSSMNRLINDNQHYLNLIDFKCEDHDDDTDRTSMIDIQHLIGHGRVLANNMMDDRELIRTVLERTEQDTFFTRQYILDRCRGYVNYWMMLSTLFCSADNSGCFDILLYDQYRSDIELPDRVEQGRRSLRLEPRSIDLVHFDDNVIVHKLENMTMSDGKVDSQRGEKYIEDFKKMTRGMANYLYSGNSRGILNVGVLKKYFKQAHRFITCMSSLSFRVPELSNNKIIFEDFATHANTTRPVAFSKRPKTVIYLPVFEQLLTECLRVKMIVEGAIIPFMQLDLLNQAVGNIARICDVEAKLIKPQTINIINSHFNAKAPTFQVKNFTIGSKIVKHYLTSIGDLLNDFIQELNDKQLFDISRCNAITDRVIHGLAELKTDDIDIKSYDAHIPDMVRGDRANVHLDYSQAFKVDQDSLTELHDKLSQTIDMITGDNTPVIDIKGLTDTVNRLNQALHTNLPILTAPDTSMISVMIHSDLFNPTEIQLMLDSGKSLSVSTINPQLDGLTPAQLEELLVKIDTMTEYENDLASLQSKIVEKLTK